MKPKIEVGTRLYKVHAMFCEDDLHIDVEEYEVIYVSPTSYACRGLSLKTALGFTTVDIYAIGERGITHTYGPFGLSLAEAADLYRKRLDYDIERHMREVREIQRKRDAMIANTFDLVFGGKEQVFIAGDQPEDNDDED
jgi:hypothetical protein